MSKGVVIQKKNNIDLSFSSIKKHVDIKTLVFIIMGFLLSRFVIIEAIAPLGLCLYVYTSKNNKYNVPVFISVVTGTLLSGNEPMHLIKYIIAISIVMILNKNIKKCISINKLALVCILTIIPLSMVQVVMSGNYLYSLSMLLIECVIIYSLVYIFSFGVDFINKLDSKICIETEEMISLSILISLSIMGIGEISLLGISIKVVLSAMLIILTSIIGGASIGASTGAIVGLASVVSNVSSAIYMGIYPLAGIISGVCSRINKNFAILGYSITWVIVYSYTSGADISSMYLKEILIASLLIMLIPSSLLDKIKNILDSTKISNDILVSHVSRNKELINDNLVSMYKAYDEVADIFDRVSEKDKLLSSSDISKIVDSVYMDECKNCSMNMKCWESRFNYTYNMMIEVLDFIEENGYIRSSDIPEIFRKECIKPESAVKSMRHHYEIFSINYDWNLRFCESRKLIANQIRDISKSIEKLSSDIKSDTKLDFDIERNIYDKLSVNGVSVNQITYLTKDKDEFEVIIEKGTCSDCAMCDKYITPIVEEILEEKLSTQKIGCNSLGEKCKISLSKSQKYKVITSASCMSKDGYIQSGDNYTYMEIDNGKYMMAISDGMGKGQKAYEESSTTIDLLEKMIDAKISNEVIISTINNMLMLKSQDEIFSTLDLSIIDLKKGMLNTTKMGACSTYVKRYNGDVDLITSSSLPVGILSEVSLCQKQLKINDGDYIVMVSDGIVDAGKNKDMGENWLMYLLKDISSTNPKEISDTILDKALTIQNNNIEDDMTILVGKILKA